MLRIVKRIWSEIVGIYMLTEVLAKKMLYEERFNEKVPLWVCRIIAAFIVPFAFLVGVGRIIMMMFRKEDWKEQIHEAEEIIEELYEEG